MKDAEDEAFDDLARRQGAWGGGFQAKRAAAADKLQEPVQEPVAEVKPKMTGGNVGIATVIHEIYSPHREPLQPGDKLYTTPPQREWVGLTDEDMPSKELDAFCRGARWADTKLKEKNNGT